MKKRRVRRPSAAMVVAGLAPIVALTGTAVAAQQLVSGPGIAQVVSLNCQAANANAEIENDGKTTDLWQANDTNYVGANWLGATSPPGATEGTTWHLGRGSGAGALVIAVTVSTQATGSSCIYQGYAQVMTS